MNHTQLSILCLAGDMSRGVSSRSRNLITYVLLVQRLNYIYTPTYAFIAWCLILHKVYHRGKFTLSFILQLHLRGSYKCGVKDILH